MKRLLAFTPCDPSLTPALKRVCMLSHLSVRWRPESLPPSQTSHRPSPPQGVKAVSFHALAQLTVCCKKVARIHTYVCTGVYLLQMWYLTLTRKQLGFVATFACSGGRAPGFCQAPGGNPDCNRYYDRKVGKGKRTRAGMCKLL